MIWGRLRLFYLISLVECYLLQEDKHLNKFKNKGFDQEIIMNIVKKKFQERKPTKFNISKRNLQNAENIKGRMLFVTTITRRDILNESDPHGRKYKKNNNHSSNVP